MGRVIKLLLGLIVGAVCLFLAFRGVADTEAQTGIKWDDILAPIRAMSWWGPVGFLALVFVQFILRSERWRIQVRGLTGTAPPHRESIAINCVAAAAVFLLPFRLGEFVRPNLSAQRNIMRASSGLAATALERAIDGLVTTGFFGIVLLLVKARNDVKLPPQVEVGGVIASLIFGGALTFFIVAFRWRAGTARLVERVLSVAHGGFARRVASILTGFLDGLACFKNPSDVLLYVALTIVYWLLNAASMYCVMVAMGLDVDVVAAFFCLCFLVIGMMIPAPPGNVGNFHVFARSSVTVFGIAAAPAVAFAIVLHALTVLSVVMVGGFFLLTGDVSVAKVRAATHSTEDPPAT
jgi:glycosyltransferase 2 family protein